MRVVYKPVAGERPLWDFPDGTLAAARCGYPVSEALGWNVVPGPGCATGRTARDGAGLAEPDHEEAVDPGAGGRCRRLAPRLRRHRRARPSHLAGPRGHRRCAGWRLDVVVNNADRKGGHVLAMTDGHRYGVDHGVTFHVEHKLRTVLWGWAGEPSPTRELDAVEGVRDDRPR